MLALLLMCQFPGLLRLTLNTEGRDLSNSPAEPGAGTDSGSRAHALTTRTQVKLVFEEMWLPPTSARSSRLSRPPCCPENGSLSLFPYSCPGRLGKYLQVEADSVFAYQVWRGGLCLRSVIIQVQIDQNFSCSPYSAGHFPYCQLAKSRGEEARKQIKGKAVSTGQERRARW